MAEVFAAVASGAGLVSLAVELLESCQKLKSFYVASKDAPTTVANLCFELETLSLQLRQLERHRQHDRLDFELLDRCITTCEKRTERVKMVVDEMTRLMRRSHGLGRMYTAFREPEMKNLLEELEQAKSSLSLAYIGYCQSWSMRDSTTHAAVLQQHSNLLALQQMQLGEIQSDIAQGHTQLSHQLTVLVEQSQLQDDVKHDRSDDQAISKRHRSLRFRLRLPPWIVKRTWEFAVHESEGSWALGLNPISYRPADTLAFQYVKTGNVTAVQKLLDARELSIWDLTDDYWRLSLLGQAVEEGQLEMCKFLLSRSEYLQNDDQIFAAICNFPPRRSIVPILELFASTYGLGVDVFGDDPSPLPLLRGCFRQLSQVVKKHQSVKLKDLPFKERFKIAMRLPGEYPDDFLQTVGLPVCDRLVSYSDSPGTTALHWAVRHWSDSAALMASRSFAAFIVELLKQGASPHALGAHDRTPLMYMLDAVTFNDEWHRARLLCVDVATLVQSWGRLLTDAGIALSEYVLKENMLLRLRKPIDRITWLSNSRDRTDTLQRLVVCDRNVLRLEVTGEIAVGIREYRPPPGSFVDDRDQQLKTCWQPSSYDGEETSWEVVDEPVLRSAHFVLLPDHDFEPKPSAIDKLFEGPHDDHSSVAILFLRDRNLRRQQHRYPARRTSSMPALSRGWHKREKSFSLSDQEALERRWIVVHKCLNDARWGFCVEGLLPDMSQSWRACMKGCQGRENFSDPIADKYRRTVAKESERKRLTEVYGPPSKNGVAGWSW